MRKSNAAVAVAGPVAGVVTVRHNVLMASRMARAQANRPLSPLLIDKAIGFNRMVSRRAAVKA